MWGSAGTPTDAPTGTLRSQKTFYREASRNPRRTARVLSCGVAAEFEEFGRVAKNEACGHVVPEVGAAVWCKTSGFIAKIHADR